jgi:hypothetical protein
LLVDLDHDDLISLAKLAKLRVSVSPNKDQHGAEHLVLDPETLSISA